MLTEKQHDLRIRMAFASIVGLTLLSFIVLWKRVAPWLPYGFGHASDCGCAVVAFQVPPVISAISIILAGATLLFAGRWGITFFRHARVWRRQLEKNKKHGRHITHVRSGVSYWLFPDRRARAFTVGMVYPQIFVSTALVRRLTGRELTAVLRHEESHAKRHDPFWAAFIAATGAMFWWPSWLRAWAASAYTVRELLADAAATRNYEHVEALSGAVLKLSDLPAPDPMEISFSPNADRVEKILNPKWTPMHHLYLRQSIVSIAISLGVVLAGFIGLHRAQASLPPTGGQCPRQMETLVCQQPTISPVKYRCVRAEGWQCQAVPNRSIELNATSDRL